MSRPSATRPGGCIAALPVEKRRAYAGHRGDLDALLPALRADQVRHLATVEKDLPVIKFNIKMFSYSDFAFIFKSDRSPIDSKSQPAGRERAESNTRQPPVCRAASPCPCPGRSDRRS